MRIVFARNRDIGDSAAEGGLPLIPETYQVAPLDPEEEDTAIGRGLLETEAERAAMVNQREVAVREGVNILQVFGDKDILLIKISVEGQALSSLPRHGGDVGIADRFKTARDADIPVFEPAEPQGAHQA